MPLFTNPDRSVGRLTPPTRRAIWGSALGGLALMWGQSALGAGDKSSGSGDSPFIGQTQIASSILVSLRAVGLMQVDLGLLVPDSSKRRRVLGLQPVLRSAWRRTVQEFTNNYFTPGRVPDALMLGQRLQAATDQIIGPNVGRVMLLSVLVR